MLEGPTSKVIISKADEKGLKQNGHKKNLCVVFFLLRFLVTSMGFAVAFVKHHTKEHKCVQEFKRRKWSCGTNVKK